MSKKVLVTGASGFLGSQLCRRLAERGDYVRAMVRKSSDLRALEGTDVELVRGDLATGDVPGNAFLGVEVVYHIAAAYRKESLPDRYYFDVNVGGTKTILGAALKAGVSRFVHCSTVGVHGDILSVPADEATPYAPGDVYQRSKLQGELLARAFFNNHKLPGVIIRPTAMYGPGDTRFLKLFRSIDRGLFWMIGDGDTYYHLTYIDDLVDGFILAGEREEAVGGTFILAGDHYPTVKELVSLIAQTLDRPLRERGLPVGPVMLAATICQKVCRPMRVEPPIYPRRLDFFVKNRAFDNARAKQVLGFMPRVDLQTGLIRTSEWYWQQGLLGWKGRSPPASTGPPIPVVTKIGRQRVGRQNPDASLLRSTSYDDGGEYVT